LLRPEISPFQDADDQRDPALRSPPFNGFGTFLSHLHLLGPSQDLVVEVVSISRGAGYGDHTHMDKPALLLEHTIERLATDEDPVLKPHQCQESAIANVG
jgi:hypothetical protein